MGAGEEALRKPSTISAGASWRTSAVPKLSDVLVPWTIWVAIGTVAVGKTVGVAVTVVIGSRIHDHGCEVLVLNNGSGLYLLHNNSKGLQDGCSDEQGWCGFCGKRLSNLDHLHNFHRCQLADRCSARTLKGQSILDRLDLRDLNDFPR